MPSDLDHAPAPAPLRGEPGAPSYPGARRPDRRRIVDADGIALSVWEWGDPDAPPVLFAHGGFDFAGTFDTLAPRVADGGYRVVSWDQRGHGDSQHAHLYSWEATSATRSPSWPPSASTPSRSSGTRRAVR